MKKCKHCGNEYNELLKVCPYCLKSDNDKVKVKKEKNKKNINYFEIAFYVFIGISLLLLFLPIIEYNYWPKDETFDMNYFMSNKIELRHKFNIINLIFGKKYVYDSYGYQVYDKIRPNLLNLALIILPICLCVLKNKKYSFIFIILDIVFLFMTRIFFFDKQSITQGESGFGYEIVYGIGFFIMFIFLIIFLAFDIYYLFVYKKESEENGNNL